MKIYTKGGDEGKTSLLGGERVSKSHERIEAYGTIDELNACLGVVEAEFHEKTSKKDLLRIQETLFTIGSHLASSKASATKILPKISPAEVTFLEDKIDGMEKKLKPLKNFILPGGSMLVGHCHLARCVCRRAERHVVLMNEKTKVDPLILMYLNRLSDYLFVLARYSAKLEGVKDVEWKVTSRKSQVASQKKNSKRSS